jgi:hypothetical protein
LIKIRTTHCLRTAGRSALRRAFANRYRHAPLRDLQDLGGWKSAATLLKLYLRAGEAAQRHVLAGHVSASTRSRARRT